MSDRSHIEWTDATWNPIRGCTKVSPGCKNCYAERFAERWRGIPGHAYEQGFDLRLIPQKLLDPLRWRKPRRVFVCSMSDLFHESIPDDYIDVVFGVMKSVNWHQYQVLTKRADRMAGYLERRAARGESPLEHVLVGVSVENRRHGLRRVLELQSLTGWKSFLSVEPLLEEICAPSVRDRELHLSRDFLRGIDWVIVGGESGPRARPMPEEWVRPIRDLCLSAGVPFFFKQWGGVNKKKAGRELDGRTWDEMPAFRAKERIASRSQPRKSRPQIQFEDDLGIPSYGYWRCRSCGEEFYGGGRALHRGGCKVLDYSSCTWIFGPQTIGDPGLLPASIDFSDLYLCLKGAKRESKS